MLAQNIALTSAASCARAPDSAFDSSPSAGAFAARQIAAMKSLSGDTSGIVTLIGWSVGIGTFSSTFASTRYPSAPAAGGR